MKYIAVHYAKVAGRTYTPGEIFEADIQPQKEDRLLRIGAVRRDEAPQAAPAAQKPLAPAKQPPPESPEDEGNEAEDGDGYEETDEDAPEIDVMDGLVPKSEDEKPQAAPKPKPRAKAKAKPKA